MQEGSEMGFTKMEVISKPRIIVVVRGGALLMEYAPIWNRQTFQSWIMMNTHPG
jgi:hypothetical protein